MTDDEIQAAAERFASENRGYDFFEGDKPFAIKMANCFKAGAEFALNLATEKRDVGWMYAGQGPLPSGLAEKSDDLQVALDSAREQIEYQSVDRRNIINENEKRIAELEQELKLADEKRDAETEETPKCLQYRPLEIQQEIRQALHIESLEKRISELESELKELKGQKEIDDELFFELAQENKGLTNERDDWKESYGALKNQFGGRCKDIEDLHAKLEVALDRIKELENGK